ncbi:FAD-dependent oxidoreductase [Dehalococcoidia bacterium]|nr:FAD-dependent oxidoreductase [Dehalococcoidia bacterium]
MRFELMGIGSGTRCEYAIVGNSAAAIGAIESIRKIDRDGGITVVSNERHHVYSRPLIAHYLAGEVQEERMAYRPADFYERYNVETRFGLNVTRIDADGQNLILDDGSTLHYHRLLISTGSKATRPPLKGTDLEGVGTFQTYDDARQIVSRFATDTKAVVIGAGLIGLRAAYGLQERGTEVSVVELLPRVLSRVLDARGSHLVQSILEKGGIRVLTGRSVAEISGRNGEVRGLILDNGATLECRIVIIATGVVPNVDLVKDTIIKVNRGIPVNQFFQTNVSNIFAAGDVAETFDIPRAGGMVNANWPNAHEQGRYAGLCMAGKMVQYPGSLGMNAVSLYNIPIVSLGIFDPESEGINQVDVKIRANLEQNIYQKLVFRDNRLKGAIFIGDLGYCGAVKDLIQDQSLVGIIKDSILEEKYQLYAFLRKKRQEKVEGKDVEWPETYSSTQRYQKSFNEESWTERERDERPWH